jgi:hypothetical protein
VGVKDNCGHPLGKPLHPPKEGTPKGPVNPGKPGAPSVKQAVETLKPLAKLPQLAAQISKTELRKA